MRTVSNVGNVNSNRFHLYEAIISDYSQSLLLWQIVATFIKKVRSQVDQDSLRGLQLLGYEGFIDFPKTLHGAKLKPNESNISRKNETQTFLRWKRIAFVNGFNNRGQILAREIGRNAILYQKNPGYISH